MSGLISCPVEYLYFGERKAEGRRQRELKEKKGLKGGGFFITDYPDMILRKFLDNTLFVGEE
ncbi:MAG: hypothetical protein F6K39_13185 [Okeania sp. SIO3B3]|nr:hypothetical protein [Okeania sp. SIO3B3]